MIDALDPHILYSNSTFFLDYIEGKKPASNCFQHSLASIDRLALERGAPATPQTRKKLCTALLDYNGNLGASAKTMANIDQLRSDKTLCVMGGQQVEFLGGPLFVAYKIASIIQTAANLSEQLALPVVPIFWSASEDHDFAEINHTRWIDHSGSLRTISFDWDEQGKPIEQLPLTEAVRHAFDEAQNKISFSHPDHAALFSPEVDDDYCTWHARIWSRLFADYGLVVVEPRILRPLAKDFFAQALEDEPEVHACLAKGARELESHGYPVLLDPNRSGRVFEIDEKGLRLRVDSSALRDSTDDEKTYSADAALRPLLADSLFPTIANVLGPSEIAYHAMLRPLYEHWQVPQPVAIPRKGATLIPSNGLSQLNSFGVLPSTAIDPSFTPADVVKAAGADALISEFTNAKQRLEDALLPLKESLFQLDPGLETRWRQAVDQAQHQLDRLEDRAVRADLARRGLSAKKLQSLKPFLRPMEKPQERILSAYSIIARYGVKWLHDMILSREPSVFEHQLIVLEEPHE